MTMTQTKPTAAAIRAAKAILYAETCEQEDTPGYEEHVNLTATIIDKEIDINRRKLEAFDAIVEFLRSEREGFSAPAQFVKTHKMLAAIATAEKGDG